MYNCYDMFFSIVNRYSA